MSRSRVYPLRCLNLGVAAALALACAAATAHDFHMGMADISYNERTGSTEIVHTYAAHDVTALLANLYQRQFDLGQPDSEAPLRRYVERQFYLTAPDKSRLALRWVGVKADADSVMIFQEIEHVRLAPGTVVHDGLLIDFLPTQKNTLNLQSNGAIQTFIFEQGRIEQSMR